MARSRRYEIGVGLLLVGAMVVLGWMALQIGAFRGLGDRVEVHVAFEDAAGLEAGAVVAMAGIQVGKVQEMRLVDEHAHVVLALDPDAGIGSDAVARIRSRSVLGEKYVALLPGSEEAPPAADGDRLAAGPRQVEIDELVATMAPFLEALDPEAISAAMGALSDALEEDPERLARILADVETVLDNAAVASEDLPEMVAEGRVTLADAREALAALEARADEAEAVLSRADALVAEAQERTPGVLDDVEAAAADTRRVMAELEASTDEVEAILDNLSEFDLAHVRELLREDGVRIRFRSKDVAAPPD